MKLVIRTQIRENYGEADSPYWKPKGGEIYVVSGLTQRQIRRILAEGIPTLTKLITKMDAYFEEYVVNFDVVHDNNPTGYPWDAPYELAYVDGAWRARREVINDEYGYMRREVERKIEEYVMLPGGERDQYTVRYVMTNGDRVTGADLAQYLAELA